MKIIIGYYLIVNLISFLVFYIDKHLPLKPLHWKVDESPIYLMSLLGGAVGGYLGMLVFRHHRKNKRVHIALAIGLVLHLLVVLRLDPQELSDVTIKDVFPNWKGFA